jgi:hypothetical protein
MACAHLADLASTKRGKDEIAEAVRAAAKAGGDPYAIRVKAIQLLGFEQRSSLVEQQRQQWLNAKR